MSSDERTIKEIYASIIGEVTATTFRGRNKYFGKIVRKLLEAIFPGEAGPPTMSPHTRRIALTIDTSLTNNLSNIIIRALSASDFIAPKTMEIICYDIHNVSEEIVQQYIDDIDLIIAKNEEYEKQKHLISVNIMLNTIDHIARALNDAVLQFYETNYNQDKRFPSGCDDSAYAFISNFTDDMFQEYLEHHHHPTVMANIDIDNEPNFSDEEA
ncbi:hypothetical protein INT47_008492 [Mucor saturninus]|uniref:Uncharacterized protein n=1 Tax=Mucor saturninus TaxID=64648 RepID=A0A8H7V882_9FUNG|nr:hypothetical protein INT47_008492 [Mucor saturninus]